MKTFGIICEFNPLHNGHKRLMDEARAIGADRIVCAMSGNAVQRGELAVIDKYDRAKAAVLCGADLVLELPYPWSASSAEFFAKAGVEILSHFCNNIIFGSECGDIDLLTEAARIAAGNDFKSKFKDRLNDGDGAAAAYFSLLEENTGIVLSSNDLLGIEYIKAAIEARRDIKFHTVKRDGADYNDTFLGENRCPSASAIRKAWSEEQDTSGYIPNEALDVFELCIKEGRITDAEELSKAILMYLRLADADTLSQMADNEGGISNRIITAACNAKSGEELFELLRTKRYTDAKLRRAVLFAVTSIRAEMLRSPMDYVQILGANAKGREILSECRKSSGITLVTKAADAPRDTEQYKAGQRLEAVFTLARRNCTDTGESYRKSAFIK